MPRAARSSHRTSRRHPLPKRAGTRAQLPSRPFPPTLPLIFARRSRRVAQMYKTFKKIKIDDEASNPFASANGYVFPEITQLLTYDKFKSWMVNGTDTRSICNDTVAIDHIESVLSQICTDPTYTTQQSCVDAGEEWGDPCAFSDAVAARSHEDYIALTDELTAKMALPDLRKYIAGKPFNYNEHVNNPVGVNITALADSMVAPRSDTCTRRARRSGNSGYHKRPAALRERRHSKSQNHAHSSGLVQITISHCSGASGSFNRKVMGDKPYMRFQGNICTNPPQAQLSASVGASTTVQKWADGGVELGIDGGGALSMAVDNDDGPWLELSGEIRFKAKFKKKALWLHFGGSYKLCGGCGASSKHQSNIYGQGGAKWGDLRINNKLTVSYEANTIQALATKMQNFILVRARQARPRARNLYYMWRSGRLGET